MYRKVFIKEIHIIHRIIVYFILFGFLLPINFIHIHTIFLPMVYLYWKLNNDSCILTEIEYKLKNIDHENTQNELNYPFIKKIFSEFGFTLTNKQMDKFITIYLITVWFISIILLIKYYKKKSNYNNLYF